jgi:hypothetical protein
MNLLTYRASDFGIEAQLACVRREIRMRHRVYEFKLGKGTITRDMAERELAAMMAVELTLTELLKAKELAQNPILL